MAAPTLPLLSARGTPLWRQRSFVASVACITLLCAVATFSWTHESFQRRAELLGTGMPIYATLDQPVKHFVRMLPQDAGAEGVENQDPHEDRVLRKMRRLRAEQEKLEDQRQAVIDRLTKERNDAQLVVARTAVDSHKIRLAGMGEGASASTVGRASRKEQQGLDFAVRAFGNKQAHHEKWVQYWNHMKGVREKRLKELDDMLRTGPGALHTEMSDEDREKRQTEHCTTVRKMLEELEAEAEEVEDEEERVPLLEHIEKIKGVVATCGKGAEGKRVKPDRAQDFLTKEDFLKYAANLARNAPVGPNGKKFSAVSYDDWLNRKRKPWWEQDWNIRKLGGNRVGRTKSTNQPWWKGRWNVRGQGIRK